MTPSMITAGLGLGKKLLGLQGEDAEREDELELAIVQSSGQWIRLLSLAYLMGPELAPLLPWISIADVSEYQQHVSANVAEWKQMALQAAILGVWGRAERDTAKARTARREKARRKTSSPSPGPR